MVRYMRVYPTVHEKAPEYLHGRSPAHINKAVEFMLYLHPEAGL